MICFFSLLRIPRKGTDSWQSIDRIDDISMMWCELPAIQNEPNAQCGTTNGARTRSESATELGGLSELEIVWDGVETQRTPGEIRHTHCTGRIENEGGGCIIIIIVIINIWDRLLGKCVNRVRRRILSASFFGRKNSELNIYLHTNANSL